MSNNDNFLTPLFERTSRAENVYEAIKEGIISGYWKAGDRINDQELADKYQVSRLSVREALSKLVESRILEKVHWKGYYVRKITWEELESIFEIREALEQLALKNFIEKATDEEIKKLVEAVDQSERDLKEGNYEKFMKSDFLFHEILYKDSGNPWIPYILSVAKILIDILRKIEKAEGWEEVGKASVEEHREIIEKIKSKDKNAALRLLKKHLQHHKERVVKGYQRKVKKS